MVFLCCRSKFVKIFVFRVQNLSNFGFFSVSKFKVCFPNSLSRKLKRMAMLWRVPRFDWQRNALDGPIERLHWRPLEPFIFANWNDVSDFTVHSRPLVPATHKLPPLIAPEMTKNSCIYVFLSILLGIMESDATWTPSFFHDGSCCHRRHYRSQAATGDLNALIFCCDQVNS